MGLRQNILDQLVTELEWRELLMVRPDDTIRDAVRLMREKKLGCVVVVDGQGRPLGTFTERYLIHLLVKRGDVMDAPVGKNMSDTWGCVKDTDPISKAIDVMQDKKLRFIIVVDAQGKAIGLTGQKGLMEFIVENFPRQVKVQMVESKLFMDQREGG